MYTIFPWSNVCLIPQFVLARLERCALDCVQKTVGSSNSLPLKIYLRLVGCDLLASRKVPWI